MLCTTMDSSQRALQTDEKFSPNSKLVFEIFYWEPKNIQTNSEEWIINQDAMCYISIASSRQAVQSTGKLFLNF